MSLDVALQSVLFYVLSCSTCNKISHRRKRKQQARRERLEKAELETEQPGLYRHPSPFSTNPYWDEDISLGPSFKKNKKNDKCKDGEKQEKGEKEFGDGATLGKSLSPSHLSFDQSSGTVVGSDHRLSGDNWNRKRYQREDEELWGHEMLETGQRFMDAIAKAGSDAIARAGESVKNTGRMLEERLSTIMVKEEPAPPSKPHPYLAVRNPPVNDLHPPVVSTQPTHRSQTRWMLQPPPPAKIMEGKQPVTRSRSGSNGSSISGRRVTDTPPLSRQLTEKLLEEKLKRGEGPEMAELIQSESRAKTSSRSSSPRWHDREIREPLPRSSSPDKDSSSSGTEGGDEKAGTVRKTKTKTKPLPLNLNSSTRKLAVHPDDDEDGGDWSSDDDGELLPARPPLTTIVSSSLLVNKSEVANPGKDAAAPPATRQESTESKSSGTLVADEEVREAVSAESLVQRDN